MPDYKVYILDRSQGKLPVYSSWLKQLTLPYEIVTELSTDWKPPRDAAVVVTHYHYQLPETEVLRRVTIENRVPVLILADGILEFRNTWDHPGLAEGAIFQPVLGHKIAVIGASQARVVESWGNPNKCEIVGLPKCDVLLGKINKQPALKTGRRILIATAQTPGFNEQQKARVVRSLRHLRDWFKERPNCVPVWRLSGGFDQIIGVAQASFSSAALYDVLDQVDAVITTPSTVYLEAALAGKPTALLDYNLAPQYVPSAWTITARKQIGSVINELLVPPVPKLAFQHATLHDALQCETPATERLIALITSLYHTGKECRRGNRPIRLKPRILGQPAIRPIEFAKDRLFASNSVFKEFDVASMQVIVNHYREEIVRLQGELNEVMCENQLLRNPPENQSDAA